LGMISGYVESMKKILGIITTPPKADEEE